jgi:hypothetical protein
MKLEDLKKYIDQFAYGDGSVDDYEIDCVEIEMIDGGFIVKNKSSLMGHSVDNENKRIDLMFESNKEDGEI